MRFAILLALLSAPIASAAPFELGQTVSGEVTDATVPVLHTVDVPAGTTVYLQRTATSNATGLNWSLTDAYGRVLAANATDLGNLGPVALMGGTYTGAPCPRSRRRRSTAAAASRSRRSPRRAPRSRSERRSA